MTQTELNEILRLHKMWLAGEDGGKQADLSRADLSGANLREANLNGAVILDSWELKKKEEAK